MKVLVTGGTGVIGSGVVPALVGAGHTVRLLTRGAERDARRWPKKVEPFAADVSDAKTLAGACDGCGAVVHITGIVRESPPRVTFERVNVGGTRNVLAEAERAGVGRFVLISSLGAERGASPYHRSKLKAEGVVRKFRGDWLVIRPGAVYGPGDEVVSTLLKMVRALPAVPVVGQGDQRFQPVWYEDFGESVARAVTMKELSGQTLEVAGPQITTTDDLIERLGRITNREPARVPVPSFLASLGVQLSELISLDRLASDALNLNIPLDESKLTMLLEENFIAEAGANALTEVFNVEPTPLDDGLRALADSLPELLPSEGFGRLRRKRYWADIRGGPAPEDLMRLFRERCAEVMPIEFDAEPGTPRVVKQGTTLTASLPARGHIQMRVAEAGATNVTFVTLEGHPLAGLVRFSAEPRPRAAVRFAVELHARAANALDFLTMSTLGSALQDENWREVVSRMVELSGGDSPRGVQTDFAALDEDEAARVEQWAETLVLARQRAARPAKKRKATPTAKPRAAAAKPRSRKSTAKTADAKSASVKNVSAKNAAPRKSAADKPANTRRRDSGRDAAASVAGALANVANAALSAVENISRAATKAARQSGKSRGRKR
ncbi:MAG TPA: NAD-dependent epimerase/dehydratase family protein [Pyrinomonadaceae bacterium]|nr:NAD-dependent epimerase/dehydratase family protein [Pyrinomonadaceae bacterium]